MNEYTYRIENRDTLEVMEFTTFKNAWKRLNKLRASEGDSWPYVIRNTRNGKVHTFLDETCRKNRTHHAILWARANKILDAVDLLDDSKALHPTAISVYKFARDMKVGY